MGLQHRGELTMTLGGLVREGRNRRRVFRTFMWADSPALTERIPSRSRKCLFHPLCSDFVLRWLCASLALSEGGELSV